MRILVTDGDARAALAVTRALGRQGHEVWVGAPREPSLAQTSRYCARRIVYPDPVRDPAAFLDALAQAAAAGGVELLLPVTEITTLAVTGARDRFEPACQAPFAPASAIDAASNKAALLARAERLGVPIPRTTVIAAPDAPIDPGVAFPVVVKPHRSRVWTADGWVSGTVSHAADRAALERDLAGRPRALFPLLLQERIVGPGVGVFACYDRGRPVALFSHRRLREKPPEGGVSVLCESTPVPPVAGELAQRLLGDLDWHGVAMVEFKQDDRDGTPRLMEINGTVLGLAAAGHRRRRRLSQPARGPRHRRRCWRRRRRIEWDSAAAGSGATWTPRCYGCSGTARPAPRRGARVPPASARSCACGGATCTTITPSWTISGRGSTRRGGICEERSDVPALKGRRCRRSARCASAAPATPSSTSRAGSIAG